MAKIINTKEAKEIIEKKELVIIDFFATWCGPCQMFGPIFTEYSEKNPDIKMFKIDIDKDPDFASEMNVMGVPTIVVFKNGNETNRFSGFKTFEELDNFIKLQK